MSDFPRFDLHAYLVDYPTEMGLGAEDPAEVLGRYHCTEIEYVSDGIVMGHDRLVAHAGPARRNARSIQVDVHDALVDGDRVAARYTMTTEVRKRGTLVVEVCMFGRLCSDGRVHRIDQITRDLG